MVKCANPLLSNSIIINDGLLPSCLGYVRLPGFTENIKHLTLKDLDDEALNVDDSYLECPHCKKSTTHYHYQMKWVNTCDKPARKKIGIKLGAFAIPEYVTIPMLVSKYARQTDINTKFFSASLSGTPFSIACRKFSD